MNEDNNDFATASSKSQQTMWHFFVLAFIFIIAYIFQRWNQNKNLLPPRTILDGIYLWIAIFLYILPFVRSMKIGKLFELERDLGYTKENMQNFKEDVRTQINILSASVTAVTTNQKTIINNSNSQMGSISNQNLYQTNASPIRPDDKKQQGLKRTAMEMKILNTLWVKQINIFGDVDQRFTFKIEYSVPTPEARSFNDAINKLTLEGLIASIPNGQYLLTDSGLRYCLDNYKYFPLDIWFDTETVDDEKISIVKEKILKKS